VDVAAEAVAIRDFDLLSMLGDLPALAALVADGDQDRIRDFDCLLAQLENDGTAGRLLATVTLVTAWGHVA
jgi:hypothetical protein